MPWSWKLARIAGIDVYMHVTFLVLLGWIAMVHWVEGRGVAAVVSGVGFILALFGCVVKGTGATERETRVSGRLSHCSW